MAGNSALAAQWITDANSAGTFVMGMYDASAGRFYSGTANISAANVSGPGSCPDAASQKGNDVLNTCDSADSDLLAILTMAASHYQSAIDWRQPISYVLSHFAQSISVDGQSFNGIDLVAVPTVGPNGISWEYTSQAVVAMQMLGQIYATTAFQSNVQSLIAGIQQAQASAPFGDGLGVVASTLQSGDTLAPIQQCLATPFECIPERVGLAATAWAALAALSVNPVPGPTGMPASISALGGSEQSTLIHTNFDAQLEALVTDLAGNPLSGVSVTFSAPTAGASGTFAADSTVVTNGQGIAIAPVFAANGTAGSYQVTAAAGSLSAVFSLTNSLTPPPVISAGGVVSASSFGEFTSVAPGSWIEIYGSSLASGTRAWQTSDFSGVNAPTSLDWHNGYHRWPECFRGVCQPGSGQRAGSIECGHWHATTDRDRPGRRQRSLHAQRKYGRTRVRCTAVVQH